MTKILYNPMLTKSLLNSGVYRHSTYPLLLCRIYPVVRPRTCPVHRIYGGHINAPAVCCGCRGCLSMVHDASFPSFNRRRFSPQTPGIAAQSPGPAYPRRCRDRRNSSSARSHRHSPAQRCCEVRRASDYNHWFVSQSVVYSFHLNLGDRGTWLDRGFTYYGKTSRGPDSPYVPLHTRAQQFQNLRRALWVADEQIR
jgi:hypothetical protein